MKERVLSGKKNGIGMMVLSIILYIVAILLLPIGGIMGMPIVSVVGVVYLCLGWILFLGLKVVGPQEALVLTLFGKYYGSIKEEGFYFVNPFCIAVNPAAETKLNQSGDVESEKKPSILFGSKNNMKPAVSKKVSLKVMTLNNSRQKINDCLGNPIEIGIAVIWKVRTQLRLYST